MNDSREILVGLSPVLSVEVSVMLSEKTIFVVDLVHSLVIL